MTVIGLKKSFLAVRSIHFLFNGFKYLFYSIYISGLPNNT